MTSAAAAGYAALRLAPVYYIEFRRKASAIHSMMPRNKAFAKHTHIEQLHKAVGIDWSRSFRLPWSNAKLTAPQIHSRIIARKLRLRSDAELPKPLYCWLSEVSRALSRPGSWQVMQAKRLLDADAVLAFHCRATTS
jgi:hypothetical protein